MLGRTGRVGVAVSGGADSVVLLHILRRVTTLSTAELVVLHVNHKLRGGESEEDERFVRSLAESVGLKFVSEEALITEGNLESEARRLRLVFFAKCLSQYGLERVAVGHTRSDQAETVLHRLLRGSGLTGLAAMRPVTDGWLVRPLLTVSREEIREWARREGLSWREDRSNEDLRFTRNRLRLQTMPELIRGYNANLEAVLAATAELAQAEEEYWPEVIEPIYARLVERMRLGLILDSAALNRLPLALRRRVLRQALAELRPNSLQGLDFHHFESILALCESAKGHDRVLVPGVDALRSFDSLLLSRAGRLGEEPREYRVDLPVGGDAALPYGAGRIFTRAAKLDSPFCDTFKNGAERGAERATLDGKALEGEPLLVRNWEPGDELLRPGHRTADKIKTLFQEHRIRLWERRHWPVVVSRGKVVWARQFGADERFAGAVDCEDEVQLTYLVKSSFVQDLSQ